MQDATGAVVAFEHVTKRYPGANAPAVDDLSLEIPAGDICVLVGPSGCGKTTSMKMVNRLIEPTPGRITIDGEAARAARSCPPACAAPAGASASEPMSCSSSSVCRPASTGTGTPASCRAASA